MGLRLPISKQTAWRLTSAMAWFLRLFWSFPISVQAFIDGLKRSTCEQKQDITPSDKEFHTIPHLWGYTHHRVHWSPPDVGSGEQLWDCTVPWEKLTLPWTTLLKGSNIKVHLQRNYHDDFDNDCLHDCITIRENLPQKKINSHKFNFDEIYVKNDKNIQILWLLRKNFWF